ncbi:MAG: hypothetical protein HFH97_01485 [Lachnospiraceae bacterium]|jgi:hypothetical protein|nr:hypothetical protein [uncultured Acetatifactor sp.]MCI9571274.1 hypothetical protein [Lachnospiraceae bacterium]
MENTISFKKWAEKWWQENYKKEKVTINDIEEVGRRLRKAIYAVFGFGNQEEVNDMYDEIEINDILPNTVRPLGLEGEQYNLSVLSAVEGMPDEGWPEHVKGRIARIKELMAEKEATIKSRDKLAKVLDGAKEKEKEIERERWIKKCDKIERIDKEIENLKAKLLKNPLGKAPIFEVVGETEGRLYNFLLEKIGGANSIIPHPYSYADIQNGYWEKVDINDRCELYGLVKELCEDGERHIALYYGKFSNEQFDLCKFRKKIFLPQMYRCKVKAEALLDCFGDVADIEMLEGNGEFLNKLDIFEGMEKRLDSLLKETEDIHTPSMEKEDIESWLSDILAAVGCASN